MIARAVMEQLQEEKRDEMAALRADIYSDVKVICTDLVLHDPFCFCLVEGATLFFAEER